VLAAARAARVARVDVLLAGTAPGRACGPPDWPPAGAAALIVGVACGVGFSCTIDVI